MPAITALRATRSGRVAVHVDGTYTWTVSAALVARFGLHRGRELSTEEAEALGAEASVERALTDAYRLLAHRVRATGELRQRLAAKGHSTFVVAQTIARLAAEGLLDDAEFARAFVADRIKLVGWGSERIVRELKRFGVADHIAAAALAAEAGDDELSRATAALARQGLPRGSAASARRRAFAFLRRRGFSPAVTFAAVRQWGGESPHSDEDAQRVE